MHTSPITATDATSDGKHIATAGYDGRVILWESGARPLWTFKATDLINHVAFDRHGATVAAACADGFVYLLATTDGAIVGELGPHGDDVNAVAWHPRESLLACVVDAKDPVIALWDAQTGKALPQIKGHEHGIFAISFDATGTRLVTAAEDGTARIWDVQSRSQLAVLPHPGDPETADWSPAGDLIATGCDDGVLRLWDAGTGKLLHTSQAASAAVRFVRFSPDGKRILSGSYDGCLRVHSVPGLSVDCELTAPFQWERSAAFCGDNVVVGSFGAAPIVHSSQGKPAAVPATRGINSISGGNSDAPLCVGRDDGAIVDLRSGNVLHRHCSIVNTVSHCPTASLIASGDYAGTLRLYDWATGSVKAEKHLGTGPINSTAWHHEGCELYTAGYDGRIRVWTPELELKADIPAHDGPIKSLAWSRHGQVLVAGSSDDSISGWRGSKMLYKIEMDDLVLINCVAASPVEPRFATASRDSVIRIWHAETGELMEALPRAHTKSVKAIAFNQDGSRLVTGSYDGYAILWSKQDQRWTWRRLNSHGKPGVPAVMFEGDDALTAGWDGTVCRWNEQGSLTAQYFAGAPTVA